MWWSSQRDATLGCRDRRGRAAEDRTSSGAWWPLASRERHRRARCKCGRYNWCTFAFLPLEVQDHGFGSTLELNISKKSRRQDFATYCHLGTLGSEPPIKKGSVQYQRCSFITDCSMLFGAEPTLNSFEFNTGSPPPSSESLNCEIISRRSVKTTSKSVLLQKVKRKMDTD